MEGLKFGGEVRRVHVVYFLCRNGKVEQPHLIRVHHLHRHGVHLRDVKRWLTDLRGKEMPESFAWSYKRRYKSGYVWQDLTDDDLITPIADNEYLLKGSEIPHKHNNPLFETFSCGDTTPKRETGLEQAEAGEEKQEVAPAKTLPETLQIERDDNISPQPPPRLDQESPEALTPPPPPPPPEAASDESLKQTTVFKIDAWRQQEEERKEEGGLGGKSRSSNGYYSGSCRGASSRRSYSYHCGSGRRSSHVFRGLLWCKAADATESVLFPVQRRERDQLAGGEVCNRSWSHRLTFDGSSNPQSPIGTRKSRSMNSTKSSSKTRERPVSAIYKPVGEPSCSQCGKAFKPDKLHSHMKSCKALRGSRKESSTKRDTVSCYEPSSCKF